MKRTLLPLLTVLCLSSPALVAAQSLECPEPAPVFTEAGAHDFDLQQLAQRVGTADLDGQSLGTIAKEIRSEYPDAKDADVADIMITAFCNYLNTNAPSDHRSEANVAAFENQVYDAVFGGAPAKTYKRQGWLYGN
ncbi:hypothetical protein [Sagittula stellata]|uniref:DUF732 domain-containing protein n=1 Tax=Sagittula stellata (strain ATCC 700073 / DSM 11524 / E-37) TaxID=388399 RepID=A3JYZ1_SAGS3|nr:hypothetical protein [Sagittula stellata]EBA09694.1 hypothetical protein SSE37_07798 [Sagittula stellata E-37]